MISAMPLVNPVVTGSGMNRISAPARSSPPAMSSAPAIIVATSRPSMPKRSTMLATSTTNAPVGSADLHARAAEAGNDRPGDDGRDQALARSDAGRDAEGDGERDGHDADDDAGGEVLDDLGAGESGERVKQLRPEAGHGGKISERSPPAAELPGFPAVPLAGGGPGS